MCPKPPDKLFQKIRAVQKEKEISETRRRKKHNLLSEYLSHLIIVII